MRDPVGEDVFPATAGSSRLERHRVDAVRAVLAALGVAGSAWLAHRGTPTVLELNAFRLVNQLPGAFGPPLLGAMQLGALMAVPAAAGLAVLRRRPVLARHLLVGGGATWLLAKGLQRVVDQEPPEVVVGRVILHGAVTPGLAFPATHVAVAAALATVAAPYLSRPNRRLAWWGVLAVGVARVYVGAHFPVDAIGGAAVGWGIGSTLHLVVGSPRGLPGHDLIRRTLAEVGLSGDRLEARRGAPAGTALYRSDGEGGQRWAVKVLGRGQPEADWLYRAWRLLAYREHDRFAQLPPRLQVEHEAYVLLLAQRAGVRVPTLLATKAIDEGEALLVRGWIEGTPLDQLSPSQLTDAVAYAAWQQVEALHRVGISCGGPPLRHLVVDADVQVWLVDLGGADTDGGPSRFAQDHAELCVAMAATIGPERAARTAATALDRDGLCALLDHLQPLALSPPHRPRHARDDTLGQLRTQIAAAAGIDPSPVDAPAIVAARNLVPVIGGLFLVNLLLPRIGQAGATAEALRHARWGWVVGMAVIAAGTYLAAAVALIGAAGRRLGLGRTWAVQLAAAFTNRLAPAGLGGMTTNARYLRSSGATGAQALTAVGLNSLGGFVVHLVGVAAVIPLLGAGHARVHISGPELPDYWPVLIVVVVVLVVAGLVGWGSRLRRAVLPPAWDALVAFAATMRNPRHGLALALGSVGVTAGYAMALVVAAQAFSVGLPVTTIVAVYLGGSAVASVAPTPGGLGALEATLVAGLTAAGSASGPAVAAVLVYRLVTYWLPVLPGIIAYRALRRRGVV